MEYPLSKPIEAHDEKISVLTFEKPDGTDVLNFGVPLVARRDMADPTNTMVEEGFDQRAMFKYIAKLAKIPPSSVKQIEPCDLVEIMGIIASFFTKPEIPKASSTGTSNSPGSSQG
jgi:hypothetical protein